MSLPSTPISIKPSASEIKHGVLSQKNLEVAVRAIQRDGLVVVEDMVPHEMLDRLNEKMVKDAYELSGRKNSPFNYHKGNIQQDPLLTDELFFEEVFVNPIVTQVTSTVLGPNPSLRFISGNTALPPSLAIPPKAQPTHTDADFDHPSIPFALVINVPLITMTPENGSTQVWLGTQITTFADQEGEHGERASGRIKKALLEERKKVRAPCQPVVEKGSVVVRDLRLWHGGMPNRKDGEVRVMLAMIHFAPWYRNQMTVEFAEELKDRLTVEKSGLQIPATFVKGEDLANRYLNRPYGNAYDFDQVDKVEGVF